MWFLFLFLYSFTSFSMPILGIGLVLGGPVIGTGWVFGWLAGWLGGMGSGETEQIEGWMDR